MKSYGLLRLTETSPAQTFTEPITVDEVKTYLKLPVFSPPDTSLDATFELMIESARETAEMYQGRDLVAKQWDLTLDYFPCEINLRQDVATVDLVQYTDSSGAVASLAEGTDFIVDQKRGILMPAPNASWPGASLWPTSAVLVRYTVSPRSLDKHIRIGMLMLIAAWHEGVYPFIPYSGQLQEYPFAVTQNLSYGKVHNFA